MDRQHVRPTDIDASALPCVGVEHVVTGNGSIDFDSDSRVGSQKSAAFRFDARHVLYGKLRPYLNKVATPDFSGRCSTELIPLLPRDGVDREFLAHLLRRPDTVDFVMAAVTGSRMPRADMKLLLSMRVPLPPIDEQRRIVAILNRAARIERLRARAAERLQEFVPALFVRMFGDPVENPKGWDVALLGEVIRGFEAGKNVKAGNGSTPLRILKVSAVTSGEFDPSMGKPAPDDYVAPGHHHVRVGDLLISRANGVIRQMASGISMKNISQAKLKRLPIIVPPLAHQTRYRELAAKAQGLLARAEAARLGAAKLSSSVMATLLGSA